MVGPSTSNTIKPLDSGSQEVLKDSNEPKKSQGFRIKKAANIAFIVLTSIFATTALAGISTAVGIGLALPFIALPLFVSAQIVAGLAALTSLAALSVLGFLKAWQLITPHLPEFLRVPLNNIQSSVCGLVSACALAIIWPIDYSKKNIKPQDVDPSQPIVIGVHGLWGSSNNWMYLFNRLREAGYHNLASVNLGNWLDSIDDDYVLKLRDLVKQYTEGVKRPPGETLKVQFLCHSMGGLVAREYNQRFAEEDGVEVVDIITLGTPLNGTNAAILGMGLTLGQGKAIKQMRHGSDFVREQQAKAKCDNTHYFHVASKCDHVIRPNISALEGNGKNTEEAMLDATGHISYLFSDETADVTINYMKKSKLRRAHEKEMSV